MQREVARAEEGVALAAEAGAAISQIESSSKSVVSVVAHISNSLREQSATSQDLAHNVERVAHMTDETTAVTEQTRDAAAHVDALAQRLQNAAGRFRLA